MSFTPANHNDERSLFDIIGQLQNQTQVDNTDNVRRIKTIENTIGDSSRVVLSEYGLFTLSHITDADLFNDKSYTNVTITPGQRVARLMNGFLWSTGGICVLMLHGVLMDFANDQHVAHMFDLLSRNLQSHQNNYVLPVCVFDNSTNSDTTPSHAASIDVTKHIGWCSIHMDRFMTNVLIARTMTNNIHEACYTALKHQIREQSHQPTISSEMWADSHSVCTLVDKNAASDSKQFLYESSLSTHGNNNNNNKTTVIATIQSAFANATSDVLLNSSLTLLITNIQTNPIAWNDSEAAAPTDASELMIALDILFSRILGNNTRKRSYAWVTNAINRVAQADDNIQVMLTHFSFLSQPESMLIKW